MNHKRICEDPTLLTSLMRSAAARLAARERLPDLELAMIIEGHRGKALPAAITAYLTKRFRGEIRDVKGPKLQSEAAKDFRFGPADNLYRRVVPIFEYLTKRSKHSAFKGRNADTGHTPSERALDYVIEKLKVECD